MADFSKFRTSIGGFNRTDVSEYIEALCAEHQKSLRQCEEEKTDLAGRLAQAEQALEAQKQINQSLQEEMQEKEAALQAALAPAEETEDEAPDAELEAEAEPETPDYLSMELEAYRRAEAAERLAMERAARLRQSLNALLEGVSNRYQEAGQEVHALTEDIRTNLKRLEDTLSELDVLFDEATDSFDTLDTEEGAVPC